MTSILKRNTAERAVIIWNNENPINYDDVIKKATLRGIKSRDKFFKDLDKSERRHSRIRDKKLSLLDGHDEVKEAIINSKLMINFASSRIALQKEKKIRDDKIFSDLGKDCDKLKKKRLIKMMKMIEKLSVVEVIWSI